MTDMMVYLTKLLTPWRLLSPVDGNNKVASLKAIMAAPDERLGFRIDRGDQRLQSEPSFAAKRQVFLPQQGSNHLVVSAILARLAKKSPPLSSRDRAHVEHMGQGRVNALSIGIGLTTIDQLVAALANCTMTIFLQNHKNVHNIIPVM